MMLSNIIFLTLIIKQKILDLNKYVKKYRKKIEKKLIFNLKDFKETSKLRDNNHKWEYILIKNLSDIIVILMF